MDESAENLLDGIMGDDDVFEDVFFDSDEQRQTNEACDSLTQPSDNQEESQPEVSLQESRSPTNSTTEEVDTAIKETQLRKQNAKQASENQGTKSDSPRKKSIANVRAKPDKTSYFFLNTKFTRNIQLALNSSIWYPQREDIAILNKAYKVMLCIQL